MTKLQNMAGNKKVRLASAMGAFAVTACAFAPFVFAGGGGTGSANVDIKETVKKIMNVILDVFFYIGLLLLAWSVGMLVLAFKNEDADSKSRAMMLLVVSASLMGIKTLLSVVLPSGYIT